uniref:DUF7733 domain-containing protein n=1 Tax=Brassica oleracea var. oleracea TaxID=109376 RepID=A0A0D3AMS0_BRAOL
MSELRRYGVIWAHRVCFMLELGLHFSSAMNSVCGLRFSIPYLAGQLPCCSPLLLSPFQTVSVRRMYAGKVLAAVNLGIWSFNLFGVLIPVYLPRAFKRYYGSSKEV